MKLSLRMIFVIKGKRKAFTFIELFLVIAILGILIGVSVPTFRKAFQSQQLKSFTQELQSLINYLHERAVVEEKIIYLNIDDEKKEYWTGIKDNPDRLKTYRIPYDIRVVMDKQEILFYPDGRIEPVTITLTSPGQESIFLTTKGIFGGAKVSSEK